MKKTKLTAVVLAFALSGCATNGNDEAVKSFTNAASNAGSSIANGVGGLFKGYESGVKISEKEMKSVKTLKEVVAKFGHPNEKEEIRGTLVYKYPYIMMPHFGTNINEYTVFEFNKSNKVIEAYKTNKKDTGISVLDQAAGW